MPPRRRSNEDTLNPERVFFRMIKDYSDGRLSHKRTFLRAIVIDVDTVGGQLEANPPNPPNSIRARVYTDGLDANIPSEALTIFYPFFPAQMMPTIVPQEHVFVLFEDSNYSNGMWFTQIPIFAGVNFDSPDLPAASTPTTADTFEGRTPADSPATPDTEYGHNLTSRQAEATREAAQQTDPAVSFWRDQKVLIIGDSQVHGLFGSVLVDTLRERGATAVKEGRDGWGVISWLNGKKTPNSPSQPKLADLIRQNSPTVVIISLGGNDHSRSAQADYVDKVSELWTSALVAPKQFWVGPCTTIAPSDRIMPGRTRASQKIAGVVGDKFINSLAVTDVGGGRDARGLHFQRGNGGIEIVRSWARLVADRGR